MFRQYQSMRKDKAPPAFGEDIRAQQFHLDPEFAFLNTGARGVVPKQVLEEVQRYAIRVDVLQII